MHKILQSHLLRAFVANLKIDTIYALYPESFCDKNLAIWKVFAFCDSVEHYSNVATWSMGFRSKKWGDEWVTVMTTTPTAVLKNDM